ncbi:MAG: hypothetical protein NMNS01_03020 [Nitrosomonas sp.]|nr:MAG: hypothetical protein NMNS01_03020 [Nitrosomonas sp.]
MTYAHKQFLAENTRIGVYEINDVLKVRPFDIIYRAWNHHLKEWVVLHEYFPGEIATRGDDGLNVGPKLASDKENFEFGLKAFLHQAEILMQIEHPNIAVTENKLQLNGTVYRIEDYQAGMSDSGLENSLTTTFSETKVRSILASILTALQTIHAHKIVHGGIHPGAILISGKGEPMLTDFAAARLAIALRTGKLEGELSPGYAPVEQYDHAQALGPATDFYALGATMYHCLTHIHPVAVQDRLAAISNHEPDPMILRASRLSAAYSVNLLETIDWMLRPDYQERPQTAAEILTALDPEYAGSHVDSKPFGKKAMNGVNTNSGAKDRAWIFVMAGIIALIGSGLWFGEQNTAFMRSTPGAVTASSLSQQSVDQVTVNTLENKESPVAETGLNQVSEPEKISEIHEIGIQDASKKQLTKGDKKTTLIPRADDNRSDVEKTQQPAVVDKRQISSVKPVPSEKAADNNGTIKWYLAAAEKAMKEMRFTTPVGNSAFEYYQTVLAADPNNAEALAGLQNIVDAYIRLIEEAKTEGLPNTARVYLQRAEAVLPEASELRSIRAELVE